MGTKALLAERAGDVGIAKGTRQRGVRDSQHGVGVAASQAFVSGSLGDRGVAWGLSVTPLPEAFPSGTAGGAPVCRTLPPSRHALRVFEASVSWELWGPTCRLPRGCGCTWQGCSVHGFTASPGVCAARGYHPLPTGPPHARRRPAVRGRAEMAPGPAAPGVVASACGTGRRAQRCPCPVGGVSVWSWEAGEWGWPMALCLPACLSVCNIRSSS